MCSENIYVTNFQSLSLKDYIIARSLFCEVEHSLCAECPSMLLIAETVISDGHCKLSDSFKKAFPSVPYKTDIARRIVYISMESKPCTEMEGQLLQSSFRAFLATQNMANEDMRLARVLDREIVTDSESEADVEKQIDAETVKKMISKRCKSLN